MKQPNLSQYLDIITKSYRSLEHPDFSFVKKASKTRPYEPILRRIRDYAALEELTDADDDVCFSYLLKGNTNLWKLDLSMVGPFGIFVRLSAKVKPEDFVHGKKSDLTDYERKITTMLSSGGIKLLTAQDLSAQVPMTLFNTGRERVRLYQALFSDRENLPWE